MHHFASNQLHLQCFQPIAFVVLELPVLILYSLLLPFQFSYCTSETQGSWFTALVLQRVHTVRTGFACALVRVCWGGRRAGGQKTARGREVGGLGRRSLTLPLLHVVDLVHDQLAVPEGPDPDIIPQLVHRHSQQCLRAGMASECPHG